MTGIGQLQTLAHLFQADAASAFICHAFGMIAVGYFAMYLSGAFTEVDTDKAGLSGGDAMLEGILYEEIKMSGAISVRLSGRTSIFVSTRTLAERRMRISSM